MIPVMGICFAVDILLLLAADGITQRSGNLGRMLLAAQMGAMYAAFCLRIGLPFAASAWGRIVCQLIAGFVSWGVSLTGFITTMVYLLLSVAAITMAKALAGGAVAAAALVVGLCVCCLWVIRSSFCSGKLVDVELHYGEARLRLKALCDTGNTLCDPLTGDSVMILDPDGAKALVGLELKQLKDPIATMQHSHIPGLHLVPYETISGRGLLLAVKIHDAQIGNKRKCAMVAFAPTNFAAGKGFQALTGGTV